MQSEGFSGYGKKRWFFGVLAGIISVLLLIMPAWAVEKPSEEKTLRSIVVRLEHILGEDAKQYLVDLEIGQDISILPNHSCHS